jgi:hypothetical protein
MGNARELRVARYLRVSRVEQNVSLQEDETAELIARRGWKLTGTYVDHGVSGSRESRPELDRLLRDARRGKIDVVVVWKADRLFRSLRAMVTTLDEWASLKVNFVSTTVRELAGVVTSPTLLADGRVLTTEGYDTKSGLYYEPTEDWGNLGALERPSKADAAKAQKVLLDLVKDFEFQQPIDRTCWLAEVLTVESRHAHTGNLPHFVHTANLKGTGKGKLAQLTAIIATGETVAEGTLSEDEAEREKRLCGLSISGAPVVLFDEMREVGGQTLQMVATSRRFRGRVLGETGDYTGPWDTVVVYAGNNVVTTMDMNRRTISSPPTCRRTPTATVSSSPLPLSDDPSRRPGPNMCPLACRSWPTPTRVAPSFNPTRSRNRTSAGTSLASRIVRFCASGVNQPCLSGALRPDQGARGTARLSFRPRPTSGTRPVQQAHGERAGSLKDGQEQDGVVAVRFRQPLVAAHRRMAGSHL